MKGEVGMVYRVWALAQALAPTYGWMEQGQFPQEVWKEQAPLGAVARRGGQAHGQVLVRAWRGGQGLGEAH